MQLLKLQPAILDDYLKSYKEDLEILIAIKSIAEPYQNQQQPYGTGCDEVLNKISTLAKKHGFELKISPDRTYGYFDWGTGNEIFGIFCHLDVVPPGDLQQWDSDPWVLREAGGKWYGRGVLDNKGPSLIQIYALKYLKDVIGFQPQKRIRVFFGLTEETDWDSITRYAKNEAIPDDGYVPDWIWPVVFAEKRIFNFDIMGPGVSNIKIDNWNQSVYNVISDYVNIKIPNPNNQMVGELAAINAVASAQNQNEWSVYGWAAHGSQPELGDNAITKTAHALIKAGFNIDVLNFINQNIFENNHHFINIFNNYQDDSGKVVGHVGRIQVDSYKQKLGIQCRIPRTLTTTAIKKLILDYFNHYYPTFKVEFRLNVPPKYKPITSAKVKTLLSIFQNVTGDYQIQPAAIGGGTYARQFENLIAFGAANTAVNMHAPNEFLSKREVMQALKIYIQTIYHLNKSKTNDSSN